MANDLVTRLLLNNKQFDNNLAESTRQVRMFQSNVSNINKGLLTSFGRLPAAINPLSGSFSMLASKVAVAATAAVAVGKVVKLNIELNRLLDQSLSDLKAITGDSTDTINRYREAAIELGRVTPLTANQVADAFKTLAQLKPELAETQESLIRATEASLNLANAAGLEVASAADIVTRALNVYGYSANQANRFTNVLAAGMRNGSGDIEWLGNAFGKVGATARAVGLSYEEVIATLELLSKRIKDSTSAGALLRNVLIYLEKQNDDNLKPSVVGLSQAMKNLRDRQYDLTQLTSIFRKVNIEAATTLIDEADNFDTLKDKITGTNTALEMAEEKQNNLNGAIKRLDSAWQSFILDLGNSNGVIMKVVDGLASLLNKISGAPTETLKQLKRANQNKTDKTLYNIAYGVAENGGTLAEAKKKIEKAIADRTKLVKQKIQEYEKKLMLAKPGTSGYSNAALFKEDYESLLSVLKAAGKNAGSYIQDAWADAAKKAKQEAIFGGDFENASIDELKDSLKELRKLRDASNDPTLIVKYNAQIQETQAQIDKLTGKQIKLNNGGRTTTKSTTSTAEPTISPELKEDLDALGFWLDSKMSTAMEQIGKNVGDKFKLGFAESLSTTDDINSKGLQNINQVFADSNAGEKVKIQIQQTNALADAWQNVALLVNATAGAMSNLGSEGVNVAAVVAQAIATVALAYAQTLAKDSSSKSNIWAFIAAAAGATISMAATIASIHKSTGYATGGIVGGNDFVGDKRTVRVNSGEMILNKKQQANLFNMINAGKTSVGYGGQVQFKIQGKELVGVLSNYNNKVNRAR